MALRNAVSSISSPSALVAVGTKGKTRGQSSLFFNIVPSPRQWVDRALLVSPVPGATAAILVSLVAAGEGTRQSQRREVSWYQFVEPSGRLGPELLLIGAGIKGFDLPADRI